MKKRTFLLISALTLGAMVSCGGEQPDPDPVIKQELEISIENPAKTTLMIDEEIQLNAVVKNNIDNLPVSWTSSDDTVASVSSSGLVKALKKGTTNINAKVGDKVSANVLITVNAIVVEKIEIQLSKTTIGVGEIVEVGALISPENANDKTFKVTSSDELKVRVDGHKIEGLNKTAEDETVKITVTSSNGKTSVAEVKVVALADSVLPQIEERLAKSQQKEIETLVSGKYEKSTKDATGSKTDSIKHDFEVFSDSKSRVETIKNDKHTVRTYGVQGEIFFDIYQNIDETGKLTYASERNKELIAEGETTSGQMLKNEALKMSGVIDINEGTEPGNATLTHNVLNYMIKGTNGFHNEEARKNLKYLSTSEEQLTLSTSFADSTSYIVDVSLNLKFNHAGLLVNTTHKVEKFTIDDIDNPTKGALDETIITTLELKDGERRKSDNVALNFENLAFTDYTPYLVKGWNGKDETNEFNVGDSGYIKVKDALPAEAYSEYDEITIKEVSIPDAVDIGYGNSYLKFKKECTDLVITTISKINKVEKTFKVNVNPVAATSISFPSTLHSNELVGKPINVKIGSKPTGSVANINIALENNTANATATMVEGSKNEFVLEGKNAGSVDVVVIDKNLGETKKLTKTITFHENNDVGIAQLIGNSKTTISGSGELQSIKFSAIPGESKGKFVVTYWDTDYTGTFTIKDGKFSATLSSFGDYTFTSFRLYKSGEYHRFNFTYDDDFYDTYIYTVTLK